jgi:nucleoside-diphosphate-sugar epimerase
MIIGNGLIANVFGEYKENEKYVIFASGVSDSTNNDESAFKREEQLLNEITTLHKEKIIIYFSTCSIYDNQRNNSPYVLHKIKMEEIIILKNINHLIFRVSNPIGFTKNTSTFFNYFINKINNDEQFEVWNNSYRNIIDIEDMYKICDYIIKEKKYINSIINIANPKNYKIQTVISEIEKYFNKKSNYKIIDKGSEPIIDTNSAEEVISILKIKINEEYIENILSKYFPKNE